MTGTLSLRILSSRSSYQQNLSYEAAGNPETDTVQTWVGPESTFMIHTYALDHDIRIYAVKTKPGGFEYTEKSNDKHYGDLVNRHIFLTFNDVNDEEELRTKFAEHELEPTVRVEKGAFMFWRYGHARYRTISDPLQAPPDEV